MRLRPVRHDVTRHHAAIKKTAGSFRQWMTFESALVRRRLRQRQPSSGIFGSLCLAPQDSSHPRSERVSFPSRQRTAHNNTSTSTLTMESRISILIHSRSPSSAAHTPILRWPQETDHSSNSHTHLTSLTSWHPQPGMTPSQRRSRRCNSASHPSCLSRQAHLIQHSPRRSWPSTCSPKKNWTASHTTTTSPPPARGRTTTHPT